MKRVLGVVAGVIVGVIVAIPVMLSILDIDESGMVSTLLGVALIMFAFIFYILIRR